MAIIYCCWGGHLKKRTMTIGNYLAISFFSLVLFNYFSFFSLFSFSLFLFSLFFYCFRQPLGGRSPPLRSATGKGGHVEDTKLQENINGTEAEFICH